MKTEQILPTTGAFVLGVFLGIIAFSLMLLPHYTKVVNQAHWDDEVINECIEMYPDFYDAIGEGDNYCNYIQNK